MTSLDRLDPEQNCRPKIEMDPSPEVSCRLMRDASLTLYTPYCRAKKQKGAHAPAERRRCHCAGARVSLGSGRADDARLKLFLRPNMSLVEFLHHLLQGLLTQPGFQVALVPIADVLLLRCVALVKMGY